MRRRIIVTLVLSMFSVLLGMTKIGYIPVPTAVNWATTMHIPAIIGGILEGWFVGGFVGTVFGITSMYMSISAGVPAGADPWVAILPRLFIGVTAYFSYIWIKRRNEYMAIVAAAIVGTLTNTLGVLTLGVFRGYLDVENALQIGITHGIPEIVVAAIVVLIVIVGWRIMIDYRTRQKNKDHRMM